MAPRKTSHMLLGSHPYSAGRIRIENVQWCTTAQYYAITHKDSFATKSVDFCYEEGAPSHIFSFPVKTRPVIGKHQTGLVYVPEISSSRHSNNDTNKLRSRCSPISSCLNAKEGSCADVDALWQLIL
ncbi:hypothetical protein TNCV_4128321 [Trichonephila clavipes]|nr:hypothetical protein TNCV_4128321 [Trichonephila clavipes]